MAHDESAGTDPVQPGPVYDTALRRLVEADLVGACSLIGVPLDASPQVLTGNLPTATLSADLLLRVGPRRLVHLEYMRNASGDLVARMLIYRGLIMRAYRGTLLSQHVIVLGDGTVRGHDDLDQSGFALDLRIVYLRGLDPARLLERPSLAPLAVLGRGDRAARAEAFSQAIQLIRDHGGDRVGELAEFATVLATIRLDMPTIRQTVKEVGMTIGSIAAEIFRDTEVGQALMRQGEEAGREQGREQGRESLLREVLVARFGEHEDIPAIAHRLAAWPQGAVQAIDSATSLAQVRDAPAPDGA